MADNIVNEGSSCVIVLWFKDENERNVTPDQLAWRVDDALLLSISGDSYDATMIATSGYTGYVPLVDPIIGNPPLDIPSTIVVPTTYKYNVLIPSTINVIIDETKLWEEKILSVQYSYNGGANVGTDVFRYRVNNLPVVITGVTPI
jgi:hypothetical protein